MNEIAVTAMGADRPGIVAALTKGLLGLGGNLADVRAALLRGSFAIVLLVNVPDEVDAAAVEAALRPEAERLGLGLWAGPASPAADAAATGARCVVSVYGIDHPGIVHDITSELASRGANIRDLSSRSVGTPPIYTLAIEVDLPPGVTVAAMAGMLADTAARNRVELAVTEADDDLL